MHGRVLLLLPCISMEVGMEEGLRCLACDHDEFESCGDGFYYCFRCGVRVEDIVETGVADEDFVGRGIYSSSRRSRRSSQYSQICIKTREHPRQHQQQEDAAAEQEVKASMPCDFGSSSNGLSVEDYYTEVRMRYVMGIQVMIQLQCEALVEKFRVTPLICGLSGSIWLRYVAESRVFADGWADQAIRDSEVQNKPGQSEDFKLCTKYRGEPHNLHGQRAVLIWLRSLRKRIPLSSSLVVSFLVCHMAREAVLPTDIFKWSIEGKLPYLSAFVDIEKYFGHPSSACPLSSRFMFRPTETVPAHILESSAASFAQSIGLHLPPVNFYEIAFRYLRTLCVPIEKILPHACRISDWLMPPDLWLSVNDSKNELKLPTHVCVMSILIVAIRILYNINGLGYWEKNLSELSASISLSGEAANEPTRNATDIQKSDMDVEGLLHNLEAIYSKLDDSHEYSKDLPSYLNYCKDVVFAGQEPSDMDSNEGKIIDQLWDFYKKHKDVEPSEDIGVKCSRSLNQKRSTNDNEACSTNFLSKENKKLRHEGGPNAVSNGRVLVETSKDIAIRQMRINMEENMFCYIPPRVNLKRFDYIHYVRKKEDGVFTYAAHADYYILLRACARLAQVDVRNMHAGVLSLEKRLSWVENRIQHCLHLKPSNISCQHCNVAASQQATEN